jgi:hypothetical protein
LVFGVISQVNSDAPEGKKYARFYPVLEFPYISVIDSRTGELMLKWEGAVDQKEFLHACMSLCIFGMEF